MVWYLLLALTPLLLAPLVSYGYNSPIDTNKDAKRTYLIMCGLILFLMIALRHYSLGSIDSAGYYNNWITMRETPYSSLGYALQDSDMEPGYLFTVWCLSRVFPSAQFVFVLTGLLFSIAICRVVYLNSDNVMISMIMCICLGLYMFLIQGLRQGIAISICLLAIESCKRRRFIRFLLLVILASFFHRTALVFILVYFVYGFMLSNQTKAAMAVSVAVLIVLSPVIVEYGNELLDRDYFGTVESGAVVAVMTYAIIAAAAILLLNQHNTEKKDAFFVWLLIFGMSFYLMRYFGAQAMERISFYFLIGQAIVLPTAVNKLEHKSRNITYLAVCLLSIALFFYRLNASYGLNYMFFWEG